MGMLDDSDDDLETRGTNTNASNDINSVNREGAFAASASSSAVVADMMDADSLCEAFAGCSCVFHTSAFTDPTGVSGYSVN